MTKKSKNKCIFCLESDTYFTTKEHIVPESLGNEDDILEDYVCDKCQNYFGREVESFVLCKSPIGFWRTLYGTKNKKGNHPSFDQSQQPNKKMKLANYHPVTDNGITIRPGNMDNELVVEAYVNDSRLLENICANKKTDIKMVLTPKILVYLGRFLGKIALEYWCKNFTDDIYSSQFDNLRNYARYGTTNKMWPIFHWILPINLAKYYYISHDTQERILYRYAFGAIKDTEHILFVFDIGCDRYAIIMNEKYPHPAKLFVEKISNVFGDIKTQPSILYYQNLN